MQQMPAPQTRNYSTIFITTRSSSNAILDCKGLNGTNKEYISPTGSVQDGSEFLTLFEGCRR